MQMSAVKVNARIVAIRVLNINHGIKMDPIVVLRSVQNVEIGKNSKETPKTTA